MEKIYFSQRMTQSLDLLLRDKDLVFAWPLYIALTKDLTWLQEKNFHSLEQAHDNKLDVKS